MTNRGRHKKDKLLQILKINKAVDINLWKRIVKVIGIRNVEKMLYYQIINGNVKDLYIFEKNPWASSYSGGFDWDNTKEGFSYWESIIDKIIATKM